MSYVDEYVTITELYTRTQWWRKIGTGPWTLMFGRPPVVFLNDNANWASIKRFEPVEKCVALAVIPKDGAKSQEDEVQ